MKNKERHDIKTDRFQEFLVIAEDFFVDNAKTIGYTVLGIVVILALYLGITGYLNSREESASFALHSALQDFNEILSTPDPEAETIDEVRAELSVVATEHGGTHAASLAEFYMALLSLRKGELDSAEESLVKLANNSPGELKQLARISLSGVQVSSGDYLEAAELFKTLAERYRGDSARLFSFQSAEMFYRAGEQSMALEMYRRTASGNGEGIEDVLFSPAQQKRIETRTAQLSDSGQQQ